MVLLAISSNMTMYRLMCRRHCNGQTIYNPRCFIHYKITVQSPVSHGNRYYTILKHPGTHVHMSRSGWMCVFVYVCMYVGVGVGASVGG